MAIELKKAGISHEREVDQTIYYEDIDVGTRRADFVIENKLVVEIKALVNLEDVHLAQAKNYVVAYKFEKRIAHKLWGSELAIQVSIQSAQKFGSIDKSKF